MTTGRAQRKSDVQTAYPAAELLIRGESDLRNYNEWVVGLFTRHASNLTQPGARILDFGAGPGTLSNIFRNKTGLKPDGVELDDRFRNILCERGFNGYASLSDTTDRYDVIFSSNVLEHIEDDLSALKDLYNRQTDDGVLLLYVPAFASIWTAMDDRVGHYRRYTKRDLAAKLSAAGFKVNAAFYCDSVGFILSFLFRFMGPECGEPTSRSLRFFDRFLLPVSKILDLLFHNYFGKNVFVAATKLKGN
jgi:SAM-dependent methyltransferase